MRMAALMLKAGLWNAETSIAPNYLVTMRTFSVRLQALGRSSIGSSTRSLSSQAGDTLIEVIISALLVGLIVVGTFTGLNSSNRATSIDRARSQADALAEQNEEQVRSYSIKKLNELEGKAEITSVVEGKSKYTIETTATYFPESSTASSCTSSAEAGYVQTTSTVTSPALGGGKPVQETGIVSPPAGATLTVQVTESASALQGATVTATGPSPATSTHKLETSVHGCAIMAISPGEYNINASKPGYVDPNGYTETINDPSPSVTHSVYIPAETTAKEAYYLGQGGNLKVSFITGATPSEGDTFVAFNSGMATFRSFGTVGAYATTITSPTTIYPFPSTSPYTVYAGTCEADRPSSSVIEANKSNFEVSFPAGGTGELKTIQPPVNIKVMSGKSSVSPGSAVGNATVKVTDEGCHTIRESKTTALGAMPRPGLPFGEYKLCVTGGTTGLAANRKYTTALFTNNTTSGPSKLAEIANGGLSGGSAVIYMESGAPAGFGTPESGSSC